jgi:hypothetical protein
MDQRRLRLGDILDDYCPRERRVTNHAVVAMIEDEVKQTRCTTCDTEHVYKGARVPKRRSKKETPAALYKEVLAGMPEAEAAPADDAAAAASAPEMDEAPAEPAGESIVVETLPAPDDDGQDEDADEQEPLREEVEEGPVHRQLLRAKLPRPEGQKDARPLPEFTVRQNGGRGNGNFRGGAKPFMGDNRGRAPRSAMAGRGPGGPVNGNRMHGGGGSGGGNRFQGGRPGQHRNQPGRGGPQGGFRGGQPRHGGKKGRG